MRTVKITFTALVTSLLTVGCTLHEERYSIEYRPEQRTEQKSAHAVSTETAVSDNAANTYGSATNGHLYTEAPRASLPPVSSSSVTRIYSEPTNDSQAVAEAAVKSGLLNEDEPWSPQDQASSDSDRAIVRRIRKSVRDDYALSTISPDLKITVKEGRVTLGGAVKNEQEKKRLDALAEKTAGVVNVQNQLTVKPD